MLCTTGEHEYTRYGFRRLLADRAVDILQPNPNPNPHPHPNPIPNPNPNPNPNPKQVDILQPDVTWCGGITEARRIVAQAAAYDIPVIPHGSSVYSYHLQYA